MRILLFAFFCNLFLFNVFCEDLSVENFIEKDWHVKGVVSETAEEDLFYFDFQMDNLVNVRMIKPDRVVDHQYKYQIHRDPFIQIYIYNIDPELPAFIFAIKNNKWIIYSPAALSLTFDELIEMETKIDK